MTNFTLNSSDEIYSIEKRVVTRIGTVTTLPHWKQVIFWELYGLSGEDFQKKLKEAFEVDCEKIKKVNWVMKTKLTND